MDSADLIFLGHDEVISYYRDLLARRLSGQDLLRALKIVEAALAELGGGIERVNSRLRTTLQWCASNEFSTLTLRSSHEEIGRDHMTRSRRFWGSASAHHLRHLMRVKDVAAELRLPKDVRKGLFEYLKALVNSARRLELQNTGLLLDTKNPLPYKRNLIFADGKRRATSAKQARNNIFHAFNQLRKGGWLVDAITITLPSTFHSGTSSNLFGLAGSPDWKIAADVLREIRSKGDHKGVKTFWRIDVHPEQFDTLHMHMLCAYQDADVRDKHRDKLRRSYLARTAGYRHLKVVGIFGIGLPVFGPDDWNHSQGPIYIDPMLGEEQLLSTVMYIGSNLKPFVKIVPGRSYGNSGKLFFELDGIAEESSEKETTTDPHHTDELLINEGLLSQAVDCPMQEIMSLMPVFDWQSGHYWKSLYEVQETAPIEFEKVRRIKLYQEGGVCRKSTIFYSLFFAKISNLSRDSLLSTGLGVHRSLLPKIRAPPKHFNPFQNCKLFFCQT